jgi:type IV secretory pathway VirB2 component (pilin)
MKSNLNLFIKMFLILAVMVAFFAMISEVQATGFNWDTAISNADSAEGVAALNTSATNVTGAILSVIKYVATGIALIMIVVIAAKYMLASAGDRADIKKHAVAYVTGAMILFGSAAIVDIIQGFADSTIVSG